MLWRWLRDRVGTGLAWTLLGALALCYAIKIWRWACPVFAGPAALPRVLYRSKLDRLSEVGVRREHGESREAFARRVQAQLPSLAPLTAVHVAAAFGSRSHAEPGTLRAISRTLGGELRSAAPVYKRLLGWLTPWSWLASR